MSQQISTGKRVSSVKDDGAAYTRAAFMRSEANAKSVLAANSGRIAAAINGSMAAAEARLDSTITARTRAVAGTDAGLSASARAILQQEHNDLGHGGQWTYIAGEAIGQRGDSGDIFSVLHSQAFNALTVVENTNGTGTTYVGELEDAFNNGVAFDLSTAASSQAAVAMYEPRLNFQRGRIAYWSAVESALDRAAVRQDRDAQRLEAASDRLTDADMGKLSTARAQAETRQQLALDTIKSALSGYGNYAGGLLGNVQRTQRGVLA